MKWNSAQFLMLTSRLTVQTSSKLSTIGKPLAVLLRFRKEQFNSNKTAQFKMKYPYPNKH